MTRRSVLTAILGATAACGAFAYLAVAQSNLSEARIQTRDGTRVVSVELADTEETRRTGLMFRESMPADQGMLFDFGESREVGMWMENTLIPLDMLFIDETGRIANIAANTKPLSRDIVASEGEVSYVLELNGGAAKRLGIAPGDIVEHEAID